MLSSLIMAKLMDGVEDESCTWFGAITVLFSALIRSRVFFSIKGMGPCQDTVFYRLNLPAHTCWYIVGNKGRIPIPRFTYQPSLSSCTVSFCDATCLSNVGFFLGIGVRDWGYFRIGTIRGEQCVVQVLFLVDWHLEIYAEQRCREGDWMKLGSNSPGSTITQLPTIGDFPAMAITSLKVAGGNFWTPGYPNVSPFRTLTGKISGKSRFKDMGFVIKHLYLFAIPISVP